MSHAGTQREGLMVRVAVGFTAWAEKWFPDAFIFVAIAVVVVAAAALANGASPLAVSEAFGGGFWSLITFTMQMAFVAIGGYVVATSPPASRLIHALGAFAEKRSGRGWTGCHRQHPGVAHQLGAQSDLRRLAGACAGRTLRTEDGLPGGGGRRLSGTRCHLGNGAFLLGGAAAGESCELAEGSSADHGGDSFLRNDLSLAVDRGDARPARGVHPHRILVGTWT